MDTDSRNTQAVDENQDRGNWDSKADYLLSCIGYAVGLGNVWRFPYLAFENGGGAFLIPYLIMLLFAGLPMFFLEVSIGQFSSLGPVAMWKFSPIFKGVGLTMVVVSFCVGIYYNVIVAYTIFYFFASLTTRLPWEGCDNWWNNRSQCSTEFRQTCTVDLSAGSNAAADTFIRNSTNSLHGPGPIYNHVTSEDAASLSSLLDLELEQIGCIEFVTARPSSPSEEYWVKYALHMARDMNETGNVNVHLALALLLAWIVVFYSLIKGIKSSGKVVYFTALFPYVVLTFFVINGARLEGAYEGIKFYIGSESDFEKLKDAKVWKDAATQIFYSLATAWGGLITLASYNKFRNNCFYDALLVCFVNCGTSLYAGFAIFTVLGHMAFKLGSPVKDVVTSGGFGLAFVAYPEAIVQLPAAPLWSIMFFLMLFTLGLDSQFTVLETVSTVLIDAFPRQLRAKRWQLMFMLAVVMFLAGLLCVTDAGLYWIDLIDQYAAGWGLIFIAVLEVTAVSYVYGGNRFIEDIEMMIGQKSWWFWLYWRACWFFITPTLLTVVFLWSIFTFTPDERFPEWANVIGWLLITFAIIHIPLCAALALWRHRGSIFKAKSPAADWGPYLQQHRGARYANMAEPEQAVEIAKERYDDAADADRRFGAGSNPGFLPEALRDDTHL